MTFDLSPHLLGLGPLPARWKHPWTRGLTLRMCFVKLILSGDKDLEIRHMSCVTMLNETVALVPSGYFHVVGHVRIVDCFQITTLTRFNELQGRHHFPGQHTALPYKNTWAWVLDNRCSYDYHLPVNKPSGAQLWVILTKPGVMNKEDWGRVGRSTIVPN